MVSAAVQFVYIQEKGFREEEVASGFTHMPIKKHLPEHMPKPLCMLGGQKELEGPYVV